MPDNSITIVGNVTRDPELKFLNSGQAAVRLSVAVNRRWQNRQTQEWEERVSYFESPATARWPRTPPTRSYKGTRVIVTGRLEQRSWETESRRQALDRRDQRRRHRPLAEVGDRPGRPDPANRGSGASAADRPAAAPRANEPAPYNFDEEPF